MVSFSQNSIVTSTGHNSARTRTQQRPRIKSASDTIPDGVVNSEKPISVLRRHGERYSRRYRFLVYFSEENEGCAQNTSDSQSRLPSGSQHARPSAGAAAHEAQTCRALARSRAAVSAQSLHRCLRRRYFLGHALHVSLSRAKANEREAREITDPHSPLLPDLYERLQPLLASGTDREGLPFLSLEEDPFHTVQALRRAPLKKQRPLAQHSLPARFIYGECEMQKA